MKAVNVIKSFCNSPEKVLVLQEAIIKIKEFSDLPILLHAGYPVPQEIINQVHFYINYNNSGLTSGDNHRWRMYPNYSGQFRSTSADYGLADAMQLKVCASFLENFDYDAMHIFNYDVDIDQILEMDLYNQNCEILESGKDAAYQQSKDNYAGLLFYSIKIKPFQDKVAHALTLSTWHRDFYKHWPFVAENGFYEIFSRMDSVVTHHNFQLRDLIHSPWIDLDGFDASISEYFQEGGVYRAQNGVWIFALNMEKLLTGTITIDDTHTIELTGEAFYTLELVEYPTKIIYKGEGTDEINLFTDYKLQKMKNTLTYYDPELSL
jgi:hypothetical protein